MSKYDREVQVPDSFPFPYEKPYEIQLNFMKALYKTLELGKIGIFESPTGTGKSLSVICGAMKWLTDFKANEKKELDKILLEEEEEKKKNSAKVSTAFDWLTEYQENFDKKQEGLARKEYLDKQVKLEKSYQDLKTKAKYQLKQKKYNEERKVLQNKNAKDLENNLENDKKSEDHENMSKYDQDLILDDYKSDDEDDFKQDFDEDVNEKPQTTKIFFCSRTHSQITQFIGELNKTVYSESVRLVTLGSRMNLCINDHVLKLNSIQAINDRCLEMQKNKKNTTKDGSKKSKIESTKSCPYYKPSAYEDLNTKILGEAYDIEDLARVAREEKVCPYYGARYAIPSGEIVALPYNILFQKESRESFNINLKNQVVIIDEAHNLIDTISSIHSVEFSDQHVIQASTQLNNYINKYKSRFSAKNMLYLRQLLNVLAGLGKIFTVKNEDVKFETENGKLSLKMSKIWTISEFLTMTKFFNLNFAKLLRFIDETQLEKKLMGFSDRYNQKNEKTENDENSVNRTPKKTNEPTITESSTTNQGILIKSPLMSIKQFIKALSCPFFDGRVLLSIDQSAKSTLKFMLLNPDACFEDIVKQARSIILAGGTMKPLSDFELLVKDQERLEYFTCGHVIPKDNIICLGLGTGPNGVKFDFNYNSRDTTQVLDELGKQLVALSSIAPSGMVVFFVSYDYMDKVVNHFKKHNFFNQLNEKKTVFSEPKLSSDCDRVFNEYTKCIKKPKPNSKQDGAILFAVVGGKMSEGINFSDELGRCVIIVGQPFANIKSLELQEKMQYLNKTQPKGSGEKTAGQQYYESICWKAINQSIGRAIRHQNDYASIVLIDSRYCTNSMASLKEKLPQWIGDSFRQENPSSFNNKQVMETLVRFYANKVKK